VGAKRGGNLKLKKEWGRERGFSGIGGGGESLAREKTIFLGEA